MSSPVPTQIRSLNPKERHGGKGTDHATACTSKQKAAQRIVDVKEKNAAIAARTAALPKIPKEVIDQFVSGPMSAEAVHAHVHGVQEGADRARLGRRAVASPGLCARGRQAGRGGEPPQRRQRQDRAHRRWSVAHRGAARSRRAASSRC